MITPTKQNYVQPLSFRLEYLATLSHRLSMHLVRYHC